MCDTEVRRSYNSVRSTLSPSVKKRTDTPPFWVLSYQPIFAPLWAHTPLPSCSHAAIAVTLVQMPRSLVRLCWLTCSHPGHTCHHSAQSHPAKLCFPVLIHQTQWPPPKALDFASPVLALLDLPIAFSLSSFLTFSHSRYCLFVCLFCLSVPWIERCASTSQDHCTCYSPNRSSFRNVPLPCQVLAHMWLPP